MLEFTDSSWSVLFITYNIVAHIVADGGFSEKQSQPVEIRWIQPAKELRYVEFLDERHLSIGFE
jgi:hypothetical protein